MFTYHIVHQANDRTTVYLDGDMDIDGTEIVQHELTPRLQDSSDVEFDFAGVSFVDSSGIGLLITLIQGLQACGKRVTITRLQPEVGQVFQLLQLSDILGEAVFPRLD